MRKLIKNNSLSVDFSTGVLLGELLKALEIPLEFLNDAVASLVQDWKFRHCKEWSRNNPLKKGVYEAYTYDQQISSHDSNWLES